MRNAIEGNHLKRGNNIYFIEMLSNCTLFPQQASRMSFKHKDMDSTQTEVKAMEDLREKVEEVFADENLAFPYSQFYLGWETNKV